MGKYLFMEHVLNRLSCGPFFRRFLALSLRIFAAVIAVGGLIAFVNAWNHTAKLPSARILGGIVYILSLAGGFYMAVHAILIRSKDIRGLPDSEFTLIPIFSVLSRMTGEAYAAFVAAVAVGGGILIWFAEGSSYPILEDMSLLFPHGGGETFPDGIRFMLRGVLRAVLALAGGYLLSEIFVVLEKVAGNARIAVPSSRESDEGETGS
ncbi:MAG: hypothetical protein M1550_04035 [Deltaproteobacteria bacterium]|nr:hypothetical protein [Deltaproteobacteria bacterium]